jgi:UDPglucose--hexose-1-phosphate uridylyltransferase
MSILRFDVTTKDWVIFSPERSHRPHAHPPPLGQAQSSATGTLCPFCPGNERLAFPEIFAIRQGTAPNSPGWKVRVIPNKYPALRIEADNRRFEEGFFRTMGGCGAHEVIIESPDHDRFLGQQSAEQIQLVLQTLQARYRDLKGDVRFQTIVIFKNHGEQAGTSLPHPHWQLIATPVVPRSLRLKHAVATDYFDQTGQCLYCLLLAEERAAGERVIADNDQFAAFAPYASHLPFETWILPKKHASSFGRADSGQLWSLAGLLKEVLTKLYVGLENPAFNLTINTAPRGDEEKGYFLWHMEILPRLTTPAGFELGSGMAINTVMPEEAAQYLRSVALTG